MRAAGNAGVPQENRAGRFGALLQHLHEPLRFETAGSGRPQRRGGTDARLAAAHELGPHDLQALRAVGRPQRSERFEIRQFFVGRRDDQLAAAIVRHTGARAEMVEEPGPFDTELSLQGAGRIVQARVDDAAVVRAGLHARASMLFDDAERASGAGNLRSRSEAGHAGANHEHVHDGIRHHRPPCPWCTSILPRRTADSSPASTWISSGR